MKVYFAVSIILICLESSGQQVQYKRSRFGFFLGSGVTFNQSKSELLVLQNKSNFLFNVGLDYEFQINRRFALRSGLNLNYSSAVFADNTEDEFMLYSLLIVPRVFNASPMDYAELEENKFYYDSGSISPTLINKRNYRFGYLSIPIQLVLRSKMKKFSRYNLKLGVLNNIKIRAVSKTGRIASVSIPTEPSTLLIRDANKYKFGMVLGAGFEKNFVGRTSYYFDLDFHYYLSNSFNQREAKGTIITREQSENFDNIAPSDFNLNHLFQNQIIIKFGLMF